MDTQKYELPELPYAYDALEPYIDAQTIDIHYGKHHAGYVSNLNAAVEPYENLIGKTAEELLKNLSEVPEAIRVAVKNNAGGHINHTMFWQSMAPNTGGEPTGTLANEINRTFGSFEEFKNKFNDVGLKRFGSGWVWLMQTPDGKLDIVSTPNQDNPMSDGHKPILGNDVWEHAYYLKYKNMRADYLKNWWNVVNWQEVERRFNS